jgi:hypothetical protein
VESNGPVWGLMATWLQQRRQFDGGHEGGGRKQPG